MQIVRILGGLGNQMFGYAFALALKKLGREVKLDASWHERYQAHNGWELGRIFPLAIPTCTAKERDSLGDVGQSLFARLRRKAFGVRKGHLIERGPGYDERYRAMIGDLYFDGYWQSPRYHEGAEAEIEAAFVFPEELEDESRLCLETHAGRSLIGVHVRRGDFLKSEDFSGVCGEAYFRGAIEELLDGAANPLLLFFSDDLEWCRDHLSAGRDAIFVDWNRGADSWRDMRLMSRCDRLVISNSSFSWWAARLGKPKRVVAPSRWYGGTHPDNAEIALPDWIRLDSRGER